MENRRILNWRSWPLTRRGFVVGALAAVIVSMCVLLMGLFAPRPEFDFGVALAALVFEAPTILLLRCLGWEALGESSSVPPWILFSISAIVNTILLALAGGVIGYGVQFVKALKERTRIRR